MPLPEGPHALLACALRDPEVVLRYQAKMVTVPARTVCGGEARCQAEVTDASTSGGCPSTRMPGAERWPAGWWASQGRGWCARHPLCFGALVGQEPEGEVDAFKFSEPAFCLGSLAAAGQVGADLAEPFEHGRVDVHHGAADADVFVFAGGGVGAPAVAELDFAGVEVGLELVPFCGVDWLVLPGWPAGSSAREVGLVVPDDIFVEDGDVAV